MSISEQKLVAYCQSQPILAKSPERLAAAIKNAVASGVPIDSAIETVRRWRPELFVGRGIQ